MAASDTSEQRTTLAEASEARKSRLIALRKRKAGEAEPPYVQIPYKRKAFHGPFFSANEDRRSFKIAISTLSRAQFGSILGQMITICKILWKTRWKAWPKKSLWKTRIHEHKSWYDLVLLHTLCSQLIDRITGCFQHRTKTAQLGFKTGHRKETSKIKEADG